VTVLTTRRASAPDRQAPQELPAVQAPSTRRRADVVTVAMGAAICAMPLLVPSGPGNTAPADVFLATAMLAGGLWFSARRQLLRFPYVFPAALSILAGALASTVAYAGAYDNVGGGLITLIQDAFVLGWGITIANLGRDPARLRAITRAWAASATCWAAVMIIGVLGHVDLLSGETARNGVRAAFTLGDPNLAANYFICSLLVLRAARYPRRPVLRWACCALLVTATVLTGSNGGALVLIATTILGALFTMAKVRGAAPAVIAGSALILAVLVIAPHVRVQGIIQQAQGSSQLARDSVGRQAESSGSRSTILAESAQLYLTGDTLLGLGPGGTKAAFQAHQYGYVKMAHDDYTASLIERGLLGGLALVCLLVIIAARCRRIATRRLRGNYAAVIPRPELLSAAVIGMLISATLYQVLHFRHLWALLGLIAAMDLFGLGARGRELPETPEAVR
jgi:hypothetical protein